MRNPARPSGADETGERPDGAKHRSPTEPSGGSGMGERLRSEELPSSTRCGWGEMSLARQVFEGLKRPRFEVRLRVSPATAPAGARRLPCRLARAAAVERLSPPGPIA